MFEKLKLSALFLIVLVSCTKAPAEKTAQKEPNTISNTAIAQKQSKKEIVPYKKRLEAFADTLNSMNWVSDHKRLKRLNLYPALVQGEVAYSSKEIPFYKVNYKQSDIGQGRFFELLKKEERTLDLKMFREVRSIWAYFYKEKDAEYSMPDGVIEQWEFATSTQAQKALQQLYPASKIVYFSTNPYLCQIDNYLYIFHTSTMAYSDPQKKVFTKFISTYKGTTQYKDLANKIK